MNKIAALTALVVMVFAAPLSAQEVPSNAAQVKLSFAPVVKKTTPAVVNIYAKRLVKAQVNPLMNDPFFAQFFGRGLQFGVPQERVESSLGSGVIVDSNGLIVTNAHVVKDAKEAVVVLADGREFDGEIKLVDSASDLALIRIVPEGEALPVIPLKASESLEVGDLVLAIGNPFGVGQTVTSGIVSANARANLDISDLNFFIQTDAAINPGNSGGPLVDMDGNIVGINSAIYSRDGGSLGIGFAIPSEMVAAVLAAEKSGQVNAKGSVIRPWYGVEVQNVTADIAASLNLKKPAGALVQSMHKASPAAEAGLRVGDLITALNGKKIKDAAELRFKLSMASIGSEVELVYTRKGEEGTARFKAIKAPEVPAREATVIKGYNPFSGAVLANINPAVAAELGLADNECCVVVAKVDAASLSARVVKVGDVVVAVNKKAVKNVKDVQSLLDSGQQAGGWALTLKSNGQKRTLIVR